MSIDRVLIVEEDTGCGQSLSKHVKSFEFCRSIHVTDAGQAMSVLKFDTDDFKVRPRSIACVVLDIRLPTEDGLSFLKKLRFRETVHGPESFRIPVVFVSGYESDREWAFAINGFVSSFLVKPIDFKNLYRTLKRIVCDSEVDVVRKESWRYGIRRFLMFRRKGAKGC